VITSTVGPMDDPDAVDGDVALRQMLALAAEQTDDPRKKQAIADFQLTLRPLQEWSPEERELLIQTCSYLVSLGRMGREIDQLLNPKPPPRCVDSPSDL
jgi:hypothetical protein